MSTLSARFSQAPAEVKRYMLDYSAQLNDGEILTGLAATVNPMTPLPPLGAPAFVINNIVLAPQDTAPGKAIFYASGGLDQFSYEIQFLATTSISQVFEDIVQFDVLEKL